MVVTQVAINYWAVIVVAVVHMFIGAMWYGTLFGKVWIKLSGFTSKDIEMAKKRGMSKNYIISFIAALVMSYIFAYFVKFLQITSVAEGVTLALRVWLGFIVTIMVNTVLWEGKPWKLYVLNVGYYLASLVVAGIIFSVWP